MRREAWGRQEGLGIGLWGRWISGSVEEGLVRERERERERNGWSVLVLRDWHEGMERDEGRKLLFWPRTTLLVGSEEEEVGVGERVGCVVLALRP